MGQTVKQPTSTQPTGHTTAAGLSIWKWSAGSAQWTILEDRSEEGFHPGTGPTQGGVFDGQVVRWVSVAVSVES